MKENFEWSKMEGLVEWRSESWAVCLYTTPRPIQKKIIKTKWKTTKRIGKKIGAKFLTWNQFGNNLHPIVGADNSYSSEVRKKPTLQKTVRGRGEKGAGFKLLMSTWGTNSIVWWRDNCPPAPTPPPSPALLCASNKSVINLNFNLDFNFDCSSAHDFRSVEFRINQSKIQVKQINVDWFRFTWSINRLVANLAERHGRWMNNE